MLAYGNSRPAPAAAIPDKNVIVPHVSHFPWNEQRREPHKKQWRNWNKKGSPKMMYRPNTGSPVGWQQGLPETLTKKIIEDFKFLSSQNCIGVFIDAVWEHWATQGPQYYLMAQLIWNPQADGKAILDDYYKRGFSDAAPEIKAYWDLFENARDKYLEKNDSKAYKGEKYIYIKLYTPELLNKAEKLLAQADAKVKSNSIYRKRIDFVRTGLAYTKLLVDNMHLMKSWVINKDKPTADKVKANWVKIEKVWAKYPKAFNWIWLRKITPRMVGLHPDHMTKRKKKKKKATKKTVKINTGLDLD